MDLAYDMGFVGGSHAVPVPSRKMNLRTSSTSAFCLRFEDNVKLLIGHADELEMQAVVVPHHLLSVCVHNSCKALSLSPQVPLEEPLSEEAVWISRTCRPSHHGDCTPWMIHQMFPQFPLGEPLSEEAVSISRSWGTRRHSSTTMPVEQRAVNEVDPNRDTMQSPLRISQSVINEDWWRDLVQLYDQHECTEFLEEGPVIYVNTWYLHGLHLRRNGQARPVRLDCEWQMWPEILREAWGDRIDHAVPLEIGLVKPSPPASVFQGHIHIAHLILQQAMLDESTGIVSGVFRSSQRDAITQSAQVLPVVLLRDDMIAAVPAELQCQYRDCQVFAGETPLLLEQPRRATPFSSIVVEVFPLPEDVDDFASFMAAGSTSRSRPTSRSLAELPQVAHQGEVQPEDHDSESSSEESEDLIWKYSKIFSVHQPPVEAPLHQTHERLKHMQVARAVGFRRNELLAVYDIPTLPQDLRQAQHAGVLARHADDLPDGSHHCFVLVDTEFHPIDPNEDFVRVRSPIYMPQFMTRGMLLRAMDVARYCDYVHDRCVVWHNEELFPPLPRYHLRLRHGDYLRIVLPPPNHDNARVPTRCVARLLQLDFEPEDIEPIYFATDRVDDDLDPMPTAYSIAEANSSDVGSDQGIPEDAYEIEAEDDASLAQTSALAHPRSCHDQSDLRAIYREVSPEIETANAGVGAQPPMDLPAFEQGLFLFWQQHARLGPAGMEHYVDVLVWFNDHLHYHLCVEPRTVRLYDDTLEWRFLMAQAWREFIHPEAELHFLLVTPQPPAAGTAAQMHIIMLQHPQPDFSSIMVTVVDSMVMSGRPRSWALMVPAQAFMQMIIDIMGYQFYCASPTVRCQLQHGEAELPIVDFFQLRHGMGLAMFVHHDTPLPSDDSWEEDEAIDLLQRSTSRMKLSLEASIPAPPGDASQMNHVRLFSAVEYMQLPDFLDLKEPLTISNVEHELSNWGHFCKCWIDLDSATAVCWPAALHHSDALRYYLYILIDDNCWDTIWLESSQRQRTELEHMRLLYAHGFQRAAIQQPFYSKDQLCSVIRFRNCHPQIAEFQEKARSPWPPRLRTPTELCPLFSHVQTASERPPCALQLGLTVTDIEEFFSSARDLLCRSAEGLDLPAHIQLAIDECAPLEHIDRLIIFCDGSSLAEHRRSPPLRADEEGHGDTWSFLVLAEQYVDSQASKLNLLGWTAQPVLFSSEASHFIGSDKIGSETSEREALFWSAMWRLAQNTNIPTTFCTDSSTAERQGRGQDGAHQPDLSFRLLRGVFQSLEATLGTDGLSFSHVAGHSGDPWNDFVDLAAKQERRRSFWHPRQTVDMQLWAPVLPFFWMALAKDPSIPQFCGDHFDIRAPRLPSPQQLDCGLDEGGFSEVHFQLSFCSANVQSLCAGPDGFGGKTQFIREQVQQHHLNFIGLQETRCAPVCGLADNVLRLGGGASQGHWGVELWVNLSQPIAYADSKPIFLQANDVVLTFHSPRFLIARVDHPIWHAWLVVAHGPQSGRTLADRTEWWRSFQDTVREHVGSDELFVMIDANASPGDPVPGSVGDRAFPTSRNTPFLRAFLDEFGLCLPCTFDCHIGATHTWSSPDGTVNACIDYICIPQ